MITNKFGSYWTTYPGLRSQVKHDSARFGTQADNQSQKEREDDADSILSTSTGSGTSVFENDCQYVGPPGIIRVIPCPGIQGSEQRKGTIREVREQANKDPQLRRKLRKDAFELRNKAAEVLVARYTVPEDLPLDISEEEFKARPEQERNSFHRLAMRLHNKSQNSSFLEKWFGIGGKEKCAPLD